MIAKNGGGVVLRMPKSKGLIGDDRSAAGQARRIVRSIRGAIQAKKLNGAKFNAGLLAAKARLATLKKTGDPHGYLVQLRNYIRKYRSTNPGVVAERAQSAVTRGLAVANENIMTKVRGGLERVAEFPATSTDAQRAAIAAQNRVVQADYQRLGIPGGYAAAPTIAWETFNRVG